MTPATRRAFDRWQELVRLGYGPVLTTQAVRRVDERIRRARIRYERLLLMEKDATRRLLAK